MWLQFVANQQLAECNRFAQSLSMPIGFYRDLAVGVTQSGAETWADKALFVQEASIGAPPDMLARTDRAGDFRQCTRIFYKAEVISRLLI